MADELVKLQTLSLSRSHTPARASRWWDAPAAGLLLAALLTAASRLTVTGWTGHLNIIQALTFLGVLAGLALGQSIFSSRQAAFFALAYGLFAVPWRLCLTLARISEDALWSDRLINLVSRLNDALGQVARQEDVQDPVIFLLSMSGLFWVLSLHAGYTLTRRAHPWRVILPAGLTLLVIHTYDSLLVNHTWFLAAYLFFALLLLARLIYLRRRARWRQNHVFLSSYVDVDIARVTLQVTVLLLLLAWIAPVPTTTALFSVQSVWQRVTRPWLIARARLDDIVASLQGQAGGAYDFYGENLLLGRGSELSDDLLLSVEAQPSPSWRPRYYWRARIYDHYADGQWSTTIVSATQSVTPEHFFPGMEERRTATFTITAAAPILALYVPPQPMWISHPAWVDLAYNPDGAVDMVALRANPPLRSGETYRVRSSLSAVTVAQLRAAGTDYPAWVAGRYLQIPTSITPRVRELASGLDDDNPYDVAAAITTYLRGYIHYSETISSPRPSDQEPLDWFLFDLREGHCIYYASAEVIMLRFLGIPARLAVGFAEGERQPGTDTYLVHQRDAHAWPEVYFPGLGWIEFEPTASQSPLYRPLNENRPGAATSFPGPGGLGRDPWEDHLEEIEMPRGGSMSAPPDAAFPDSRLMAAFGASLLALVLALILLVWRKRRPRALPPFFPTLLEKGLRRFDLQPPAFLQRWLLHATLPRLARAYLELNYALARLRAPPNPADTPAERAQALSRLLPEAAGPVRRLLAEYHATAYSPRPGNLHVAQQAGRDIRALSWRAALRRLIARE